MDTNQYTDILKALADSTRIKIFAMLRGGSLCACKILDGLKITQPTLSHHMKVFCACELVLSSKDGKWTYYEINCSKLDELLKFLGNTKCHSSNISIANNSCECKNKNMK